MIKKIEKITTNFGVRPDTPKSFEERWGKFLNKKIEERIKGFKKGELVRLRCNKMSLVRKSNFLSWLERSND